MKALFTTLLVLAALAAQAQQTHLIASRDGYTATFTSNVQMVRTDAESKTVDVKTEIRIIESDRTIHVIEEGTPGHSDYIEKKVPLPVTEKEIHLHYLIPSGGRYIVKIYAGEIMEIIYVTSMGGNIIYTNKFL